MGATQRQRCQEGMEEGGDDKGEGRAEEERKARSEKVILADPIRVSHLLILLRAREDLTQAEPSLQDQMYATLGGSCEGKQVLFYSNFFWSYVAHMIVQKPYFRFSLLVHCV